jgi:hypothetical protein
MPAGTANWRRAAGPGGHQRNPEWRLDEPANHADNPAPYDSSAGVVTMLSRLGANRGGAGGRHKTVYPAQDPARVIATQQNSVQFNCGSGGRRFSSCQPDFVSQTSKNVLIGGNHNHALSVFGTSQAHAGARAWPGRQAVE